MITSSTCSGFKFARSIALLITKLPRSTAETFFKVPPKEPKGVRTAATITASFISCSLLS